MSSILESEDVELVIVEPGSSDNSRKVITSMKLVHPEAKVKCIFEPDSGPANGLNKALKIASGRVIGILNGDDFFLPGALRYVQEKFHANEDLDVLLGSGIRFNEESLNLRLVQASNQSKYRYTFSNFGSSNFFQQGFFWRRDRFMDLEFNETNIACWDSELLMNFIARDANIVSDSSYLGVFRIHKTSITGSKQLEEWYVEWQKSNRKSFISRKVNVFDRLVGTVLRMSRNIKTIRSIYRNT
jgi:glycosyltransferase involved in cell wall biosynthesis